MVVSAVLTGVVYRLAALLSPDRKAKALLGDTTLIQDLIPEIDPKCDHVRGPVEAPITVIEFGDFECPHCGRAEPVVRDLLEDTDVRYVWRHLPLTDVHPQAQLAAEAAEAAAAQGAFWEMHDLLLAHQDELEGKTCCGTPDSWAWTPIASATSSRPAPTRTGSPRTSSRRT